VARFPQEAAVPPKRSSFETLPVGLLVFFVVKSRYSFQITLSRFR
jgi:hypothetical protein